MDIMSVVLTDISLEAQYAQIRHCQPIKSQLINIKQ
jgi:hypothetical protein